MGYTKITFQHGDKVRITREGIKTCGFGGTVVHHYVGANVVTVRTPIGTFDYNPRSLKLINETNEENNINEGVNTMIGNYHVAMVKFLQGTNR